jgi:hypothetical protein
MQWGPLSSPHVVILLGAVLVALGSYWAALRQSAFEKELRQKNDETITSVQETLKMVTGGNSFAYLDFHFHATNTVSPFVISDGKYPLYDVSVRVVDMDEWSKETKDKRMTMDDMFKFTKVLDVGNLNPSMSVIRNDVRWNLPEDVDRKIFSVTVNARNGWFEQIYNLRKVNGTWRRAYRVVEMLPENGRELRTWAEEGFPRNASGEIDWLKE